MAYIYICRIYIYIYTYTHVIDQNKSYQRLAGKKDMHDMCKSLIF